MTQPVQCFSAGCSGPLSPLSSWSSKSPWPHNKSMTGVSPASSCLVRTALSRWGSGLESEKYFFCFRSDIDIDQMQISQQS